MSDIIEKSLIEELKAARAQYAFGIDLRAWSDRFVPQALAFLFPHFASKDLSVETARGRVSDSLQEALRDMRACYEGVSDEVHEGFFAALPEVYSLLQEDAKAFYDNDPASECIDEIILSYPGFYAVATHRLAHVLHQLKTPILPRLISEHAHRQSGVDIHPGAQIGRSFFLDHGTGVVIGETSEIGDRVKIYQGVTLGANHVDKRLAGTKRHPTIEDDVVIYAHATILGGDTRIGANSVIGGNCWITESIPPRSIVSHRNTVRRSQDQSTYELLDFNI